MSRKRLASVAASTGILAAVALARGCQESDSPGGPVQKEAGLDAMPEASGGHPPTGGFGGSMPEAAAGSGGQVADAGCPDKGLPSEVPQDWESFTGYSCDCPVYIPGENGTPPPPIEWEACPEDGLQDVDCRIMKLEVDGVSFNVATAYVRFTMDSSGVPLLQFARLKPNGDDRLPMQVVAEVDGPIHNAFMLVRASASSYATISEALNADRYAIRMKSDDFNSIQGLDSSQARLGNPTPTTSPSCTTATPSHRTGMYRISGS